MCQGKAAVENHLKEYSDKEYLSAKEENEYGDMLLVQEMYARGLEFLPLDLYKSDARYFKVEDGKIRPPFISVDGMGENLLLRMILRIVARSLRQLLRPSTD